MREIIHAMFSDPVASSVFWIAMGGVGVLIILTTVIVICAVKVNHGKEVPKIVPKVKECDKR